MSNHKNWQYWLDTILTEAEDKLSEWEANFINDIEMKLNQGLDLTPKQADKLEQIYIKKTS